MSGGRTRPGPQLELELVWDDPARHVVDRLIRLGCGFSVNLANGEIIIAYPASAPPAARKLLAAEVAENAPGVAEFFVTLADRSRRGAP